METVKNGRRKALYLLLSVLVACGIWLYADITGSPNGGGPRTCVVEIKDVPVEFTNMATLTDRGLMLVDEGTDLTVDLKLEGTRWLVSWLDRSKIRFVVSLMDVTAPGSQSVNWRVAFLERRFTDGITVDEVSIGSSATEIGRAHV